METTYEEFIQNILDTRGRFSCGDEYHERHHIKPKCMGGTNDEDNLIDLYAREHFEAHRLLALENPENDGLVCAWLRMSHGKNQDRVTHIVTSEEYEEARVALSNAKKKFLSNPENHPMYGTHRFGEKNPNYGNHWTDEQKQKQSERLKGKMAGPNNPMYGVHRYGTDHPRARRVIRLSDLKVYDYGGLAAKDNNICAATICNYCKKQKDFMYYDEWLTKQNDLENNKDIKEN